jgi:flagellar hook-associated protein FlgK
VLGVNVKLTSGTVNNGDTFSLNVAANPDSAGLLSALGLNTFFVGNGAGGIRVNSALLDHPENFAAGTSGQPGDGSNLARLVTLRDSPVLGNKSLTFQQFLDSVIGDIGSQSQDLQTRKSAYDALGNQLSTQQQGVSGVDPNEEMIKLVQYQRGYQASAHFIATVNQTIDEMITLLGGP